MKKKQQKRKGFYVSFNSEELDRLALASHREMALYFVLKRLASFEDGWVGMFGKQTLTYDDLAQKISRPSSQGKPADVYDRTEAYRLVERLKNRGLVSQVQQLGKRLVMLLPISPIVDDEPRKLAEKVATAEPAPYKASEDKLQQDGVNTLTSHGPEFFADEGFGADEVSDLSAQSVLTVLETNTQSVPPINNEQRPTLDAVSSREQRVPAAASSPYLEKADWDEDESEVGNADEAEDEQEAPLSLDLIIKSLRKVGEISWVETPRSKALYQRWVKFRVTKEEFAEAVQQVMDDPMAQGTPDEINDIILKNRSGVRKRSGLVL